MDLSSIFGTLMSKDGISGIAAKTGASSFDIKNVLSSALPQLISGADKQNTDANTSQGFVNALSQHAQKDTSNVSGFLGNVDLLDGSKIIGHLLGKDGAGNVAAQTGVSSANTSNILSSAAPLLMSLLGKQFSKEKRSMGSHIVEPGSEDSLKKQAEEIINAMSDNNKPVRKPTASSRANTQSRKSAIASASSGSGEPKKFIKKKKD
ncbi:MAG: DUF937 domain-containing protein [Lachnospiraceae bacterium]|nr:DUF937 domain-containing protein [Lachnospiraceae bacterium]